MASCLKNAHTLRTAQRFLQEISPERLHQRKGELEIGLGHDKTNEIQADLQGLSMREARPKQLQREGITWARPSTAATDARDADEAVCETCGHSCFVCSRLRICSVPQEFLFGADFGQRCSFCSMLVNVVQ